jgi:hypothetical protein
VSHVRDGPWQSRDTQLHVNLSLDDAERALKWPVLLEHRHTIVIDYTSDYVPNFRNSKLDGTSGD